MAVLHVDEGEARVGRQFRRGHELLDQAVEVRVV